jgi:hypothetical protein
MVTTLLGTLAAALVLVVTTDTMVSANHRAAQQTLYAADAAIERASGILAALGDWSLVPGTDAGVGPDFDDGATAPRLPGGGTLDLGRLTAQRQADSDATYVPGANQPVWRLFAHAELGRLLPRDDVVPPIYLVVWIADDPDDGDGDPLRDANGALIIRSEAFGPQGARRRVEVTLAREILDDAGTADEATPPTVRRQVRMLSWRETP